MASCVQYQGLYLVQTGQTVENCTTFLLLETTDYQQLLEQSLLPPLTQGEANILMAQVIGIWALAVALAALVRVVSQRKL
jgi:hypothetical protein